MIPGSELEVKNLSHVLKVIDETIRCGIKTPHWIFYWPTEETGSSTQDSVWKTPHGKSQKVLKVTVSWHSGAHLLTLHTLKFHGLCPLEESETLSLRRFEKKQDKESLVPLTSHIVKKNSQYKGPGGNPQGKEEQADL